MGWIVLSLCFALLLCTAVASGAAWKRWQLADEAEERAIDVLLDIHDMLRGIALTTEEGSSK